MAIETRVRLGRAATQVEKDEIAVRIAAAVSAGTTDGTVVKEFPYDNYLRVVIRTWTTIEAADEWVTFSDSLTPPPISAEVVTV